MKYNYLAYCIKICLVAYFYSHFNSRELDKKLQNLIKKWESKKLLKANFDVKLKSSGAIQFKMIKRNVTSPLFDFVCQPATHYTNIDFYAAQGTHLYYHRPPVYSRNKMSTYFEEWIQFQSKKKKSHFEAVIRIVSRVVSHSRKLSLSKLFLVQKHAQGV